MAEEIGKDALRVSIVVGGRFHACNVARELNQRGLLHRLVIACPKFKVAESGVPPERISSVLWPFAIQQMVMRGAPWLGPIVLPRLNQGFGRAAAKRLEGSTIVHGWSGYSLAAFRWAKDHGASCVVERSSAHIETQVDLLRQEYRTLGVPLETPPSGHLDDDLEEYELADAISVPSLFAKRSFLQHGFAEERLVHAPFGTDLSEFSPGEKRDDVFRIVYAGALSIQKGIHHLVDGYNLAAIPNSELCLVGGATPETPIVLRNAGSGVRCVGHVPQRDLASHYQSASVFAIASIQEGMALVQAQALACGLPLVCSTNSGGEDLLRLSGPLMSTLSDGVEEYPAGYVVPIRQPHSLAMCFRLLADNPELLRAKRTAARSLRRMDLSWGNYAERLIDRYKQLRTGSPPLLSGH